MQFLRLALAGAFDRFLDLQVLLGHWGELACPGTTAAFERRREQRRRRDTWCMLTVFGACAVTFMMLMYALERRHPAFVLAFACGVCRDSVARASGVMRAQVPLG